LNNLTNVCKDPLLGNASTEMEILFQEKNLKTELRNDPDEDIIWNITLILFRKKLNLPCYNKKKHYFLVTSRQGFI